MKVQILLILTVVKRLLANFTYAEKKKNLTTHDPINDNNTLFKAKIVFLHDRRKIFLGL